MKLSDHLFWLLDDEGSDQQWNQLIFFITQKEAEMADDLKIIDTYADLLSPVFFRWMMDSKCPPNGKRDYIDRYFLDALASISAHEVGRVYYNETAKNLSPGRFVWREKWQVLLEANMLIYLFTKPPH